MNSAAAYASYSLSSRKLRRTKFALVRHSGLYSWWKKKHEHDIAIVMLHGTGSSEAPGLWRPLRSQTSPADLDHAIRSLQSNGHVFISLQDALEILNGKRKPLANAIVLTFDDGYRSNLLFAVPILRKYSVPATFFVVPRNSEARKPLWFDRLDFAIQHAQGMGVVVRGRVLECALDGDRSETYAKIRSEAKNKLRDDRTMQAEMDLLADQLEQIAGKRLQDHFETDPWSSLMAKGEIRQLSADPLFEIGSHTMDHFRLDVIDEEERVRQLVDSRKWIEAVTGRPCRFLCFPNGNFNPEAVKAAAAAGYSLALTNTGGLNVPAKCGFALNRIAFPDRATTSELCVKVSGLWAALDKRDHKATT